MRPHGFEDDGRKGGKEGGKEGGREGGREGGWVDHPPDQASTPDAEGRRGRKKVLPLQFSRQVLVDQSLVIWPHAFEVNRRTVPSCPGRDGGEGFSLEGGKKEGREGERGMWLIAVHEEKDFGGFFPAREKE